MTSVVASFGLTTALKGGRGLVHDHAAYLARPSILIAEIASFADLVSVTPGRDTTITVAAPTLPRNADVKTCTAHVIVGNASAAPTATTNVAVKKGTDAAVPYAISVDAPTRPRNVTLRLKGGEVFWRQGDVLGEFQYDLPDFAPALNAYLDQLAPEGDVALTFVLTSDTPGRVGIRGFTFDGSRIQTQTWENPADAARRVDRSFEIGFGDVIDADVTSLPNDGSRRRVRALSLDLSGQAGPERSLGTATLGLVRGEFATIASDFAAAQAVRPGLAIDCTGIAVALASAAPAAVYAALHQDDDGQPTADQPLAESRVDLPALDGLAAWQTVTWDAPVPLEADRRYWLVLRGIQGEGWLAVTREQVRPLESLRISRGGAFWRPLQSQTTNEAHGLVRLLYVPGPENPTSPVELVLVSTANGAALLRAPAELAAQVQPVRLELPGEGAAGGVRLEVHSSASGAVTLANLIQEYD